MVFAHPENVLIAMVGDDEESARNMGVAKVLLLRKQVAEESANNDDWAPCTEQQFDSLVRCTNSELRNKCFL